MVARRSLLFVCFLIGVVAPRSNTQAQAPAAASFHIIGDIDGPGSDGTFTVIRDATRVNGVIYAVGGTVSRAACNPPGCLIPPAPDTAILWRSDWGTETPQALPDIDPNAAANALQGGFDITPDGRYIASQARKLVGGILQTRAVRVDTLLLPDPAANLYLNTIGGKPDPGFNATAVAISDDGAITYGTAPGPRAFEFNASADRGGFIPPLPGHAQNNLALRGTSADGDVVVGTSGPLVSRRAYRYEHGVGVAPIPLLPGGTVNEALAVSQDGDLVLVVGNGDGHPNGQPYKYRASTGDIEPLESPNNALASAFGPGTRVCANDSCNPRSTLGGMTSDGSVVAMNFTQPIGVPFESGHAYFHNAHGWFHLTSALGANGVDVVADGWQNLVIIGISPDGTLVFGAGEHDGVVKGWVAEFGAGVLASFNPQPVPPMSTALVGAWALCDPDECGFSGPPEGVVVFTADGAYVQIDEDGFERGLYTYNGSTLALTTLFDNNGTGGASRFNGTSVGPVIVAGDTLMPGGPLGGIRFSASVAEPFVGAWVFGTPTQPRSSFVAIALGADRGNRFFQATDHVEFSGGNAESGVGTYTWAPESTCAPFTHELNLYSLTGEPDDLHNCGTISPDGLTNHTLDDDGHTEMVLTRVIDPATIPVIAGTPLSANGVRGEAFSYQVTASNAASFSATGLPDGLSIGSATGAIGGEPTVGGQFTATVVVTNAHGISDIETLTVTIAIPTEVGTNVVVEPVVPEGQGPITLSFGEITSAGTTTVTVLDPSEVPAPGNVQVAGVIYEVTTTATYQGLITLCFSYAGIDFGGASPRLFHFENDVWVDITTSVEAATETICGATTTLSPFAVLASDVVRTGFYAPVNPIAGFLNTVNGGRTVPLKFNVYVNGIEKITTTGLAVAQQVIPCDSSAPHDPVEPAPVTGGSGLHYSDGHFTFNWKVPSTPGACYMIRMTTEQDGLALTARFKVK